MKYILLIILILGISSFNDDDDEKTVWDYLISKEFTKAGAAGLMANLKVSSDIKSVFIDVSN